MKISGLNASPAHLSYLILAFILSFVICIILALKKYDCHKLTLLQIIAQKKNHVTQCFHFSFIFPLNIAQVSTFHFSDHLRIHSTYFSSHRANANNATSESNLANNPALIHICSINYTSLCSNCHLMPYNVI